MKCPNCEKEGASYDVSRKQYQKHSSHGKSFVESKASEPRTDFNASCRKCGFKWNTSEVVFKKED